MPRLFTGIAVPEPIAHELSFFRGGLPGARWLTPEDYHITLRFIGDIGVPLANEIADGLETIRGRKMQVTMRSLGTFGGDRPRAVIAVVTPTDALLGLQADHERLVRRIGAPPDTRKFLPHVTLARLRRVSPESVATCIGSLSVFRPLVFESESFVLYSSRDSTGGGPYRIESVYPLDS